VNRCPPQYQDQSPSTAEQAVASQPETLSLQSTRKSYSGAQTRGSSPSTEKDYEERDLETDLRESRAFDDVIVGKQEVNKQEGVATAAPLSDVRRDQLTSRQEKCEEAQPTEPSLQEVLVETTGLRPEENAMGTDTPASANMHDDKEPTIQEEEMQFDDMDNSIPESDTSMDENWPTLTSTTINCPSQRPSVAYLRHHRVNDKDPLEPPANHLGIGIAVLKRTFNLYLVDIVGKYRNRS